MGKTLVLAHREYHDDLRPLAHAKMTVEAPCVPPSEGVPPGLERCRPSCHVPCPPQSRYDCSNGGEGGYSLFFVLQTAYGSILLVNPADGDRQGWKKRTGERADARSQDLDASLRVAKRMD